jgi:antitoxin component HigA of HigAB toxin-antitoxin module
LLESYEEKKYPIDLPEPNGVIKYKITELGLIKELNISTKI